MYPFGCEDDYTLPSPFAIDDTPAIPGYVPEERSIVDEIWNAPPLLPEVDPFDDSWMQGIAGGGPLFAGLY